MKVYLVGAGLGAESCLTGYAIEKIRNAQIVMTTKRLFEKLRHLNEQTMCFEIGEIASFINSHKSCFENICVVASGDIGFFSIGKMLKEKLDEFDIEFISGLSSFQFLTARLGVSYEDIKLLSGHGRNINLVPNVCYNRKVFLLTGGEQKAHNFIEELNEAGLTEVLVTVGENLSEVNEYIVTDKAINLLGRKFSELSVMLVQNNNFVECFKKIKDKDFIRGKAPMTKEVIRTLSVAELDIKPSDCIIDVGAGTGSVSIELARKASEGIVLALEKEIESTKLINENIKKFGTYNVIVKTELAPSGLDGFIADKAFIGGSSGNMKQIVDVLINKNLCKKIVVNAITLETLYETLDVFNQSNLKENVICVNVANSEKIGRYNMMKAENPVYIISGEKNE